MFLKANKNNGIIAEVIGGRKRENVLVVPSLYKCRSKNKKIADIKKFLILLRSINTWILYLKLIICYISSGATNIAEVSSGFHQADWSNTLVIVYCYLISFLFCFICLLFYLFLARNLIVRICRRQVNLNLRYI